MFYASPVGRVKMYAVRTVAAESNKVLDKFKGNKRVLKNEMIHGS